MRDSVTIEAKSRTAVARKLRHAANLIDEGGVVNDRRFWWGVLAGIMFMALSDMGDLHICVGECDAAGYDLADFSAGLRK